MFQVQEVSDHKWYMENHAVYKDMVREEAQVDLEQAAR